MEQEIHVIDAFTKQLFAGNPAAVIIRDSWLPDNLMQQIASENNLAETAFLVKKGESEYAIRWFSPLTEIDFCGHATLAACWVIFDAVPGLQQLQIQTQSVGTLHITQSECGKITMRFPARKLESQLSVPEALENALKVKPKQFLRSVQAWHAIYESEQQVFECQPDLELVKQLAPLDLVVTAPGTQYDFVSRYFWPANGGDEDPVTGSIHASLAPYWAEHLGKSQLVAHQASKRGGTLYCDVQGEWVYVSGRAQRYLRGVIQLPE